MAWNRQPASWQSAGEFRVDLLVKSVAFRLQIGKG